jgi:hypothetical protein
VSAEKGGIIDMKRNPAWSFMAFAGFSFLMVCTTLNEAFPAASISLKVLNPRGEVTKPPIHPPAARVTDFTGKKIAIYWNGKAGGDNLWNNIEALLKQKLPDPTVLRYTGPFDLGDDLATRIAEEADTFIYGVGD